MGVGVESSSAHVVVRGGGAGGGGGGAGRGLAMGGREDYGGAIAAVPDSPEGVGELVMGTSDEDGFKVRRHPVGMNASRASRRGPLPFF